MGELREIKTACHACHGGCGAIVTLEDGLAKKIRPDPASPLSRGRLCPKGMAGIELLYHPERLKYPLRRAGERGAGKWERISWEDAFGILTGNIARIKDRFGAEAIVLAQGTGRHHLKHTIRFANALGTPNWIEPGAAQCYFPRVCASALTYGGEPGVDYYSPVKPACLLVWGCNPLNCGSGMRGHIDTWREMRDTRLIVVDPRRTELAAKADVWLQVRPGTDAALALGMLNIIISEGLYDRRFVEDWTHGFAELARRCAGYPAERVSEITWVPPEKIYAAARLFAASKPASLDWGCALEHTPNAFQTIRAIAMLPGITGNYDVPGGFVEKMRVLPGPDMRNEALPDTQGRKRMGERQFKLLSGVGNSCPTAHVPTLFNAVRTGEPYPVKGLLMFGNNGLLGFADSGRTREVFGAVEFISCMDLFMTPSMQYADLVLPAASWLEVDHVYGGSNGSAGQVVLCEKQVARVGECRSDEEVFLELAKRLGLDYGADSVSDIINRQLRAVSREYPEYAGLDIEKMKALDYIEVPVRYGKYARAGRLDTPTGKMELYSTVMEKLGLDPLPSFSEPPESPFSRSDLLGEYPLVLTTGGRSRQYFLSEGRWLKSLRRAAPFPIAEVHPDTAAKYGIEDGDWIYIENSRGRITQKARLTDGIDPRVVNCQAGWWYPEAGGPGYGWTESNCNFLTSMDPPYDPNSGTYQLRALLCKIYPNADRSIEDRFFNSPLFQ